jgi:anion-transporting  ArsA/GET3 family ATPase
VAELLDGRRVCVCGGSGGVGKTTTSAAIALGMAAQGARVAVVTIDPAKRLANALGLEQLQNEPRRIAPERLAAGGMEISGELWAMMLDPKRTFDELIDRIAPDAQRAADIKANRVYRQLSSAVSGSQEFTAIAKLFDLQREGDFDLLVLDTPPSRNALDFLDAPGRLTSFLEGRALKTFVRPPGGLGLGMRVLGRGASPLFGVLRRITGIDLLSDLSSFFGLLGDMTDDFSERAAAVEAMLKAPSTAFLIITSAHDHAIDEAIWFRRTLQESGLPFAGAIVNRVHHDLLDGGEPDDLAAPLAAEIGRSLGGRVIANLHDYHVLARRDQRSIARLRRALGARPLLQVPHFDDDVHDIAGLLQVTRYLFASEDERARMLADVVS